MLDFLPMISYQSWLTYLLSIYLHSKPPVCMALYRQDRSLFQRACNLIFDEGKQQGRGLENWQGFKGKRCSQQVCNQTMARFPKALSKERSPEVGFDQCKPLFCVSPLPLHPLFTICASLTQPFPSQLLGSVPHPNSGFQPLMEK